jgi:hypothetical protein
MLLKARLKEVNLNNFKPFKVTEPRENKFEEIFAETSRTLLQEYIRVRQRAVQLMLANGSALPDLNLIVDVPNNTEYLWNFKLRNGWKFTQKFSDLFLEGKAELTYVAEIITQLPEKFKKM